MWAHSLNSNSGLVLAELSAPYIFSIRILAPHRAWVALVWEPDARNVVISET